MTRTISPQSADTTWSRSASVFLVLLGLIMGAVSFATVMSMPDMAWHPARDAELQATYDAYLETGTLLIKETGSGSYGVQAPADGPLTFATWDDDPGSYIIASLMSHVTGSDSPYPGLKLAQAILVAIPLLWLPLAIARVVGRARAGFALVLLPLVIWLFNHGATLVGTEYGLSDRVSTLPVYSLYGTAASLAFLSLSLVVLLSTYRLRIVALVAATVGIAVLAAFGNLSRSLSGMGVAAAVGVLWWIWARGRWRWLAALGGALAAIVLAGTIQTGIMGAINVQRVETTGQAMAEVPDAHTAWHSLYLGLSYPQPLNGQPSRFDVTWSDEFGWAKAQEIDPGVLVASEEYDEILQGLYLDEVFADPVGAVKLYLQKSLFLAKHFGGLLLFIVIGFAVGLSQRTALRARLGRVLAIVAPLLLLGLVPAIMVMPMLYYYSELAAALGMLAAVSLGVLAWAITSWPARIRARERQRAHAGAPAGPSAADGAAGTSVVVLERALRDGDLDSLAALLQPADEVIVVSDATAAPQRDRGGSDALASIRRVPVPASADIGDRVRAGVLSTSGARLLVVAEEITGTVGDAVAAVVVDADLVVVGAADRARSIRFLRSALLGLSGPGGQRIVVLDGPWGRAFADVSREPGEYWFDELAFAADVQGRTVSTAATAARDADGAPAFGLRGTGRALVRFVTIAMRREDYTVIAARDERTATVLAPASAAGEE